MRKKISRLSGDFEDVRRQEYIFMNNPVLVLGLGLTPVVFAASSLQNAVILSLAILLLSTATRILCYFFTFTIPYRLRTMVYALVSAVLYIPVLMLLNRIFETELAGIMAFMPLLSVDTMILSESEKVSREPFADTLKNCLTTSLGFAVAALLVGVVREFVSNGTLWGVVIIESKLIPLMASPIGGFITVALLAALLQSTLNLYKKTLARRQRNIV